VSEVRAVEAKPALFRLPRTTYAVVFFLTVGITPLALYGGYDHPTNATVSLLTLFYLLPVLSVLYIARTSTRVDAAGMTIKAIFGSRRLGWADVRGLSVTGRNIYAVTAAGAVRLACVRQRDLSAVAAASGGHLPDLPEEPPHYAPSGHRR
jgi:hypothetical protein